MKIKFIKASNWLLSLAIGAVGFTSCSIKLDENDNGGRTTLEYGTPTATFKVSGKVTDTENNPIGGIEVSMKIDEYNSIRNPKDTTDNKGEYDINFRGFPRQEFVKMNFKEIHIDGNGTFAEKIDSVRFEKLTGGNGWDLGKSEVVKDIKLKRVIEDK